MSTRITVVGAGLAGLTTAVALQQRGYDTDVLRDDLYDRTPARHWSCGPILLVGDAAHPMRPHLGQGGCQGLEDAAILAAFVDQTPHLPTAFARFATYRRPRVNRVVRESAQIGKAVNIRPDFMSSAITRATALLPEPLLMRHMASVAGRSAFALPTPKRTGCTRKSR